MYYKYYNYIDYYSCKYEDAEVVKKRKEKQLKKEIRKQRILGFLNKFKIKRRKFRR